MIGTKLGPYRVEAELGAGGMGTVYVASAPAGERVAVKLVHPHLVRKEGFRARFEREVEAGRRIRHDAVVATLGAGEAVVAGQPTLYLVMELVEGQTLRALLDELGRVPEELCLHIGREVARALAAIHEAGVLHRDVKPENVLITPDHRIKVMDLGVALLADESLRLSRTGDFAGSVLYAAPEQFAGTPPDGRSDLYNLGLLLYELATGEHPFFGDDVAVVIAKQRSSRPRRPAELNPQLSPFLEEMILTLLAKDPAERLASAGDVLSVFEEGERSAWWRERARALREATAQPLRRVRIPRETSLHGRDEELARLRRAFEGARDGQGRALLVEGEAGIGKTRLLDEFLEDLRRDGGDVNLLYGSYPAAGAATASGGLSTAYREFFGAEGLADRLAPVLREVPDLVPAFAALLLGAPPPAPLSRDAMLRAFVLVTEALARQRPTVVVIEDLHLAPETGRAIFAALAAAAPGHRVLLVGTTRRAAEWARGIERLVLSRLTPKDLARLLVELFRSERLAEELGWAIATKSDGNPFFVFELFRSLREDELIARAPDGTWVKTQVIRDIQVPSSVLDLVEARIRDLGETDRDLLEVASCCGFEFDPLLVAATLGLAQIPAMKRFAHLEKDHRLVRAMGRHYVFDHHQVQEALYRGMPVLLREPYHAKLGDALERRCGPEPGGAVAVDLCEHFLAGAAGERALRHLPAALQHLADGYLHDAVIDLAGRALAAPGLLEGAARVRLLLRQSESLEMRGRHDEGGVVLDEARTLADAIGDPALRAEVRILQGRLCIWRSDYEAAQQLFSAAREIATQAAEEKLASRAAGNLGVVFYRQGRYDEALPLFEESLEAMRALGDRRGLAVAMLNLGNVFWYRGQHAEARAQYERYRELSREIGYREGEALAEGNLGNVCLSTGRLAEALTHYEAVLALAAAIGDRHKVALFQTSLGMALLMLGRHGPARERFELSLSLAREIGMPREEASALEGLAGAAREEGDLAGARKLCEEALVRFEAVDEEEGRASCRLALAELAYEAGDAETARRRLSDALADGAGTPANRTLCEVLRAVLTGDAAAAEREFAAREARLSHHARMQARDWLFRATGDVRHLEEARRLLRFLQEHAPPADRDTMIERRELHRRILGGPRKG